MTKEHQFCPNRKWAFDYAVEAIKVAVEFEGGILEAKSGHRNFAGIQRDIEKYNEAAGLGWHVIRLHAKNYKTLNDALQKVQKVRSLSGS